MISIRLAQPGDEPSLCRLNQHVHALHLGRRPDHYKVTQADAVGAWFREALSNPKARCWLAEAEAEPAGYVLAFFSERGDNPFCAAARWCEVDQLAVAPERRQQGIARALLDAVTREAAARGISRLEANTWCFNDAALRAFERLGFRPKSVRLERGVVEHD